MPWQSSENTWGSRYATIWHDMPRYENESGTQGSKYATIWLIMSE